MQDRRSLKDYRIAFAAGVRATMNGVIYNKRGREMQQYKNASGYLYISVRVGKRRTKFLVHRLVAEAFIPHTNQAIEVNHKDGCKTNNNVSNLEWVTASENQMHSRYVLNNSTGFKDTPVICIETGKEYRSTRAAWRDTGVSYNHISECARGKRKSAGGLHWRGTVT